MLSQLSHYSATCAHSESKDVLEMFEIITLTSLLADSPPDPAELDWVRPTHGHFRGGEEIVIKGSKMTSRKH